MALKRVLKRLFFGMRTISNKKAKILLITHFNFTDAGPIHGPVDSITSYLQRKKIPYLLIAHPLYVGAKAFSEDFNGKRAKKREFGLTAKLPLPIKSLIETYYSISLVSRRRFKLVVAIDPLNCFAALILKRLNRITKVIFYTVDYAKMRFPNKLFNFLYHITDLYCVKNAGTVWNVSTRIIDVRKKQGVEKRRNIFVPNSPSFSSIKRSPANKVDRFKMAMVIGATHMPVVSKALLAIKDLVNKYPSLRLVLIGPFSKSEKMKNRISSLSLGKKVEVLGFLEHKELIKVLKGCGLGLALYTKDFPWTYYGDSMKAREYLVSGLPVIITNTTSTADDISNFEAGIVVKPNSTDIKNAIGKLFSNKDLWLRYRSNALSLAEKFDIDKILDKQLFQHI